MEWTQKRISQCDVLMALFQDTSKKPCNASHHLPADVYRDGLGCGCRRIVRLLTDPGDRERVREVEGLTGFVRWLGAFNSSGQPINV